MATSYTPRHVKTGLGWLAAGASAFAILIGGAGSYETEGWAMRELYIMFLILGTIAFVQDRLYRKQTDAAWNRFHIEDPEGYHIAFAKSHGVDPTSLIRRPAAPSPIAPTLTSAPNNTSPLEVEAVHRKGSKERLEDLARRIEAAQSRGLNAK